MKTGSGLCYGRSVCSLSGGACTPQKTHAGTDARKEGRKDPHRAASFGIVDQKERKNNGRVRKPQTGRTEGENPVDRIDFDSPFVCTSVILCDCKIHLISNYEDKCTRDSVTG